MAHRLKKYIEAEKVLFGIKQTLKNSNNLDRVIVTDDCRDEVIELLKKNKVDIELMEFNKSDLANKLELGFKCEVFGIRK